MRFTRAVTGFGVAALLALIALVPLPAAAGPTVYSADMVCADVSLYPISIVQNDASAHVNLTLTGPGNSNLSMTVKGNGLPPSTPAACAVVCVVDGILDLFDYAKFKPCGNTTAGGKLTFTGTVPFVGSDPFEGGCLLPVPALWIKPQEPPTVAPVPGAPLVVCTAGFGNFLPFEPCLGSECGSES